MTRKLKDTNSSDFLSEIHKQIEKYEKKHSNCSIVTCDIYDVYEFLRKAEKKVTKMKNYSKLFKEVYNKEVVEGSMYKAEAVYQNGEWFMHGVLYK